MSRNHTIKQRKRRSEHAQRRIEELREKSGVRGAEYGVQEKNQDAKGVIPAQAGIQNPGEGVAEEKDKNWIPAFAGMTQAPSGVSPSSTPHTVLRTPHSLFGPFSDANARAAKQTPEQRVAIARKHSDHHDNVNFNVALHSTRSLYERIAMDRETPVKSVEMRLMRELRRLVKGTEHELPAEEMILAILTMRNTALLKWTEENPYGAIKSIDVSALAFATRIHRERLKALEEESGVRGAEYGVEDRGQGSGVGDQKEKKAGTDVIPASRLRESATAEQAAGMTQAPDEASSPDSSAISATSVDESSSPPSRRCAVA